MYNNDILIWNKIDILKIKKSRGSARTYNKHPQLEKRTDSAASA